MCGRYARSKDQAALVEEFAILERPAEDLVADYNVAPTKRVYIVAERPIDEEHEAPRRSLEVARWGLVPSWAKDISIGSRLINARVETVDSKPAFRRAFARRRCLVPADGFYEWYEPPADAEDNAGRAASKRRKQPFFIHGEDDRSLALAGLFEWWRDPSGEEGEGPWLMSMTIITTTATDALGRIHDRMPLPIPEHLWDIWLDPESSQEEVKQVLHGHTAQDLLAYPVSTAVNNVRNNGAQLMEPLPAES